MSDQLPVLLKRFDHEAELPHARTPPASWYLHPEIAEREAQTVFSRSWQMVARVGQLAGTGDYVTAEIAGEPVVIVRDAESLRAFYNVCRHHAAQVATGASGCVRALHCPYHGWTYNLDGSLRNAPHFEGAADFEAADYGLRPIRVGVWSGWVFVCLDPGAGSLQDFMKPVDPGFQTLASNQLRFHQRVTYTIDCNWKVFVDNYLDGGYHVPYLHRELNGALDTTDYRIEVGSNFCLQSCPISPATGALGKVRAGEQASYYWIYPNLMINVYEDVMDVNLVLPLGPERCQVHFDYYFADRDAAFRQNSIEVADRVQLEDVAICESVQRGLHSRSYDTGRLSPVKEAGERLFHQLLYRDLSG